MLFIIIVVVDIVDDLTRIVELFVKSDIFVNFMSSLILVTFIVIFSLFRSNTLLRKGQSSARKIGVIPANFNVMRNLSKKNNR